MEAPVAAEAAAMMARVVLDIVILVRTVDALEHGSVCQEDNLVISVLGHIPSAAVHGTRYALAG